MNRRSLENLGSCFLVPGGLVSSKYLPFIVKR